METIEITKEQKQMLEAISKDNNISLTNTIDYMIEVMENYSDRKVIEELEASKQRQPNREYIAVDELDALLEKRERGELTDEDIDKL